ncbi:hypothetical protein VPH47_08235 [Stenotrophomonas sp. WED208]|uniref:DUF7738 domain-containing protein n=1 Tax=Stenotrophomonas sp. WED208 TaxID=3112800 RepID=UPI0034D490BE
MAPAEPKRTATALFATNSRRFLAIALSSLFAPCSAAPQDEQPKQKPAAIFENGSILIGSQRVELGAPVRAWIAVLGSDYRFADPELPIMMIWDELGIAAYTGPTKEHRVNSVSFVLRVPPRSSGGYEPPGEGIQPRKTFSGAVSFSGTPVNNTTQVDDIPRLSGGLLEVHCSQGIALCSANRTDQAKLDYSFYFSVDDKRYSSYIYKLNIEKDDAPD